MNDQEAMEAALRRRVGTTGEALEAMRKADEAAPWRGRCRSCGATVVVTLTAGVAVAEEHECG